MTRLKSLETCFPPRDEIEALVELRQQPRNLRWIVLKIAVDRDDGLAARLVKAGDERRCFPEVAAQAHDAHVLLRVVQPSERREGSVGRAVVDEDRLPGHVERLECRPKLVVEERDAPLLVVHGYHDGDHVREVIRWAWNG